MLQSKYRQVLLQMSNVGLLVGITVWIIAVIRGAQQLRTASHLTHYIVQIGPFTLMRIVKKPLSSGFTVSFSLETDLVWYAMSWLVLGFVCGIGVLVLARRKQLTD